MATQEQNDLLTRTGPDTKMGKLMRRYWIPCLLTSELPAPDCPPVRLKILSERLLAFRDSDGTPGLIDEFCAHRGVSLWFGRNEEGGIRCPYHGWKYNTQGQCIEVPSEPAESGFCDRIKLTSYPLIEKGGVIWAYMGAAEDRPPEPDFEWLNLPPENVFISKRWQESNYLQAMEGGIDSAHVSFLHSGDLKTEKLRLGSKGAQYQRDRLPKFEIVHSDGGLYIGARRNAENDSHYWRITQWIMPWYTMVPPYGDSALHGHAWVPIDDGNNFAWTISYHPTRALTDFELENLRAGDGIHAKLIPGSFQPVLNKHNDYGMDRAAQKEGLYYSGIRGIANQDASLQESMGPIQDRTRENLSSTDNAIIMARQRLRKAAVALEKGAAPAGLDPETHRVRSASFVLPVGTAYLEREDALKAVPGTKHVSI